MFANFERMRRELDALFGDLPGGGGRTTGGAFSPPVDVYYVADPPRAVVHVELAGIRPAELDLTVRGRELILAGVRRPPGAGEERVYQQLEVQHGAFRRAIALGADVDATAAQASYEDGVLTVELPIVGPIGIRTAPVAARGRRWMIEISTPGTGGEEVALGTGPELPARLPVLPLRDTVAFPDTLTPLAVGQERSIQLINDVLGGDRMLALVLSRRGRARPARARQTCTRSASPAPSRGCSRCRTGRCGSSSRPGPRDRGHRLRDRAAVPRRRDRRPRPTSSPRGPS